MKGSMKGKCQNIYVEGRRRRRQNVLFNNFLSGNYRVQHWKQFFLLLLFYIGKFQLNYSVELYRVKCFKMILDEIIDHVVWWRRSRN